MNSCNCFCKVSESDCHFHLNLALFFRKQSNCVREVVSLSVPLEELLQDIARCAQTISSLQQRRQDDIWKIMAIVVGGYCYLYYVAIVIYCYLYWLLLFIVIYSVIYCLVAIVIYIMAIVVSAHSREAIIEFCKHALLLLNLHKILDNPHKNDQRILESLWIHKLKPSLNDRSISTELSTL